MNLITRIIPALILGLSGPTLAVASPSGGGNSSFSFSFSSGYAAPHAGYAYRDNYRPHARAYSPYYQPPAHVSSTYVEKRIYNYSEGPGQHGARYGYREHGGGGYRRGHGGGGYYGRPATPAMPASAITEHTAILYAGRTLESVPLNPLEAGIPACKPVPARTLLNGFLTEVQSKAYHVAYGALWEREVALDTVQESMLRFVEYYRNKPKKEWPALFRTVLNSKINDQRRKRLLGNTTRKLLSLTGLAYSREGAEAGMAENDLPQAAHDEGSSQPEAGTTDGQLKQHIKSAMGELSERQRQVFLLREQLGLSIRETAETLGCSENSIKQHHFRALRAMRKSLAEVWEHEHA